MKRKGWTLRHRQGVNVSDGTAVLYSDKVDAALEAGRHNDECLQK